MARSDDALDRRAWLLAIGRRLRAEYDAVKEPLPSRLAELVKQLERTEKEARNEPPASTDAAPPPPRAARAAAVLQDRGIAA
jgi:anti-sigma factor NepR-like protein